MKPIKIAAAVLNQTPMDWDTNERNMERAIREARKQDVRVLCLPELCITGYGCDDVFWSPTLQDTAIDILHRMLPHTAGMVVSFGLPLVFQNCIFNVACLVGDGKILGFAGKKFLAADGIHYEPRWFKPWPTGLRSEVKLRGKYYPVGDIFFDLNGVRIGFEICEDAWVASRPGGAMAQKGVDIILNPSASHFAFGKYEVRKRFVLEGSRAFGVVYAYSNLVGNESGRAIYDGGGLIASCGKLLAEGERFTFADCHITTANVDIESARAAKLSSGSFRPNLEVAMNEVVQVDFDIPRNDRQSLSIEQATWERSPRIKEEEFTRAIALALFDYMRKSRSRGFVVSMSGGADSAAVATLTSFMVRLALQDSEKEEVLRKLAYLNLPEESTVDDIIKKLLLCVYQATEHSGETTRNAAESVTRAIGGEFLELSVDDVYKHYVEAVGGALGREITWGQDDIALQNIQARVRGPSVWMLTNIRGSLLLATSNRSEAAVGYATMDGDTCGGLSPIAGIDKAYLRRWLKWVQTEGPEGIGPIPEMSFVNEQQPTAELRPREFKQTDEKDLMPYEVLDAIERAAIRDKFFPEDAFHLMVSEFPQYSESDIRKWVARFYTLFARNQWKRERYAPSFHVDDKNLDPKTWCRFPILSGGYERELKQLRESVEGDSE